MALLQISEPGLSTAPHQHRLAVGIDLGTTNSLVATVRNGISVVLNDENGRAMLPSVVRYVADGGVIVGEAAQAMQSEDAANTIVSVKRFMGRGLNDIGDVSRLPYRFVDTPATNPGQAASPFATSGGSGRALRTSASRLLLVAERHSFNAALLVDGVLGLRNAQAWARSEVQGQPRYHDEQGGIWGKLDIVGLLAQPDFLQIGA